MMHKHAKNGFTLIEIMIAIAIVAIMAATVGPALLNQLQKGRISSAKQGLRSINSAIELFNGEIGQYPESLKDLVRRPTNEEIASKWVNAYIKDEKQLNDPWGNKFQYQLTPDNPDGHPYELSSYGPKGKGAPKVERLSVWNL